MTLRRSQHDPDCRTRARCCTRPRFAQRHRLPTRTPIFQAHANSGDGQDHRLRGGRRACGWFSTTTAAPPARAPARTASGTTRSFYRGRLGCRLADPGDSLQNNPTVVGFDLHNEPPTTGRGAVGGANDWARAAERRQRSAGDQPEPADHGRGIGTYQGDSYWWGGQCRASRIVRSC